MLKKKKFFVLLPSSSSREKLNEIVEVNLHKNNEGNDACMLKEKHILLTLPTIPNGEKNEVKETSLPKNDDNNNTVMLNGKQLSLLLPSSVNEEKTNQKEWLKLNSAALPSSSKDILDTSKLISTDNIQFHKNNKENDTTFASESEDISNLVVIKSNQKNKSGDNWCVECKTKFSRSDALRKHVMKFHPTKLNDLLPSKNKQFQCEECNKKFVSKYTLLKHKCKQHLYKPVTNPCKIVICTLCKIYIEKKNYISHCEQLHNINILLETLTFSTYQEFEMWKKHVELDTKSKYVRQNVSYRMSQGKVTLFYCHRSEFFQRRKNRIKQLKTQCSDRLKAFCPSKIHVLENKENKFIVQFTKTHVGHESNLEHLFLTKCEKEAFATKLAANMSYDAILDEIRDSNTKTPLRQLHLLEKKVGDIEQSSKLNADETQDENVDTWVKNMKIIPNSFVLFYKPKGRIVCEMPLLESSDFIVIFMNYVQGEILKKFGSDCICIDNICNEDKNTFDLVTLLTVDNLKQGFPCAFLITNNRNQHLYELFFSVIKEKCGKISPQVFMSDMNEMIFKAWDVVMGAPIVRIYCSWHVDSVWRKELKKIKNIYTRMHTYKLLRIMLEEKDMTIFNIMLNDVVFILENDPDSSDFATSFKASFLKCIQHWANSYIMHNGININVNIEEVHKTLKYLYLNKKDVQRLDKSIYAIMRFIREKLIEGLIFAKKGEKEKKIQEVKQAHEASLIFSSLVLEASNGWTIKPYDEQESYHIGKGKETCMCTFKCEPCNICLHSYICSCTDFVINWNICKHVHLISSLFNKELYHVDKMIEDINLCPQEVGNLIGDENDSIRDMKETDSSTLICDKKNKLKNELSKIVESARNIEEIEMLQKILFLAGPIIGDNNLSLPLISGDS